MTKLWVAPLCLLGLLLTVTPHAAAHPGALQGETFTRLLADCSDDYFGSDVAGSGSHDVIALDIREIFDADLGDAVAFRLMANGGSPSASTPITDTLALKAGGVEKTFAITTTDNQAFTGTFDKVAGPFGVIADDGTSQDGTRFGVEGLVRLASLGGVGAAITEYRVTSRNGDTEGDFMPGTFKDPVTGTTAPTSCTENYNPPGGKYTLRGPTYYASLTAPAALAVPAASSATMTVTSKNLLAQTSQNLLLTVTVPAGFEGSVDMASPREAAPGASLSWQVTIRGPASASGTIQLALTTDAGGHIVRSVAVDVAQPAPSSSGREQPSSSASGESNGIPGLPLGLGLLALAIVARRT